MRVEHSETIYRIKHFKNAKDRDFLKSMKIYSDYFDPKSMTDINEISLWLDTNYTKFNDRFYCLGLIINNQVIGYAQFAYFRDERLIFVDYIVIDEKYRRNDTFYIFVYKIKDFIQDEHLMFNYIIAEVVNDSGKETPYNSAILIIRLLKLCGFGVVKAMYHQPKLGIYNIESDTSAIMMIRTNSDITELESIKKETYIDIVKTVYFKHYKRWYSIYEEANLLYESHLNERFDEIILNLKKKKIVYVNGYKHLLEPRKNIDLRYKNTNHLFNIIISAIFFICFLTIFLILFIKEYDIKPVLVVSIFLLILVSFFGFLSVFYKQANKPFIRFLDLFKYVFDKLR